MVAHEGRTRGGSHRRRAGGGRSRPGRPRRHGTGGWRARRARRASGRDTVHRPPWRPPPAAAWQTPARHQAQRTTNSRGSGTRRHAARSKTRSRDPGPAAGALAGHARRLVVEYAACASYLWSFWPCQPFGTLRQRFAAWLQAVSIHECIDLCVDSCQGLTRRRGGSGRPARSRLPRSQPGDCPTAASRSLLGRQPPACPARSAAYCAGMRPAQLQVLPGQRLQPRRAGHGRSARG